MIKPTGEAVFVGLIAGRGVMVGMLPGRAVRVKAGSTAEDQGTDKEW